MIVPVGYIQAWLRVRLSGLNRITYTQLGWQIDTPPYTQANADALIDAMAETLDNIVSADTIMDGGHVLVGNDGGNLRYDVTLGSPHSGGRAGTGISPQVAILIQKRTALGGRRNRGRMYIAGASEGDIGTNGSLSGTLQTAVTGACDGLMNLPVAVPAANISQPVLLHDEPPTTPTVITDLAMTLYSATQRRRNSRSST